MRIAVPERSVALLVARGWVRVGTSRQRSQPKGRALDDGRELVVLERVVDPRVLLDAVASFLHDKDKPRRPPSPTRIVAPIAPPASTPVPISEDDAHGTMLATADAL